MGQWKTINDFRKEHGISQQAVRARVLRGTLKSKVMIKKVPTLFVWDEPNLADIKNKAKRSNFGVGINKKGI